MVNVVWVVHLNVNYLMLLFLIVTLVILAIGALSYFASAWYGLRSSNFDKLPPHYRHLRQKLNESPKPENRVDDLIKSR
ncbi:MAG: hypothetical protein BGO59_29315 [Spirosoma sp. 48-14]|nr:MAG: hypothetical protein BGO59_29315 [Spirosoma sp. 48-14]